MLLSVISLIILALMFLYSLFSFNIKKHWYVHLILIVLLSGIVGTLYVCFTRYDWTKLEFNFVSLSFFIIANMELILLGVIVLSYKFKNKYKNDTEDKSKNNSSDIVINISDVDQPKHAFLICAHNSSNNIEETVVSIKSFINSTHIFIVDNGSTEEEIIKTKDICDKQVVNYVGLDKGNKTIAQLVGCYTLIKKGYKNVTICDDDLILTKWNKQDVEKHFIDSNVKCVSYVVIPTKKDTLINNFQSIEYALSSYMRLIHGKLSTCFFASGAISTWDIDVIIEVLLRHNGEFKGDDMRCGMILHSLQGQKYLSDQKKHENPYKIKVSEIVIHTKAPQCCIHTTTCECGEPSLFDQRVKSWELSRYCFIIEYIKGIFQTEKWMTRITYIMCIFSIIVDIFTLVSVGITIYFAIYEPFYTILLLWQMITVNCLSLILCWWFVIREIDSIDLKWIIIMPFTYYLPNIFYIKIPSMIYAMFYPLIWTVKESLYKRQDEWCKYII
jgi:hypothetical protein